MTEFIDTNVLIRLLTGDPPDLAARAATYLQDAEQLLLVDLILAEVVYVLESFYEQPREQIAQLARSVIAFPAITVADEELLLRALEVYELTPQSGMEDPTGRCSGGWWRDQRTPVTPAMSVPLAGSLACMCLTAGSFWRPAISLLAVLVSLATIRNDGGRSPGATELTMVGCALKSCSNSAYD